MATKYNRQKYLWMDEMLYLLSSPWDKNTATKAATNCLNYIQTLLNRHCSPHKKPLRSKCFTCLCRPAAYTLPCQSGGHVYRSLACLAALWHSAAAATVVVLASSKLFQSSNMLHNVTSGTMRRLMKDGLTMWNEWRQPTPDLHRGTRWRGYRLTRFNTEYHTVLRLNKVMLRQSTRTCSSSTRTSGQWTTSFTMKVCKCQRRITSQARTT